MRRIDWDRQITTSTGFRMSFRRLWLVGWLGWSTVAGCIGAALWLPWGGPTGVGLYSAYYLGSTYRQWRALGKR